MLRYLKLVANQTAKNTKNIPILDKLVFQYSIKKIIEIKPRAVVPDGRNENTSMNNPPIKVRKRVSVKFIAGAHMRMVMSIKSGATLLTLSLESIVT